MVLWLNWSQLKDVRNVTRDHFTLPPKLCRTPKAGLLTWEPKTAGAPDLLYFNWFGPIFIFFFQISLGIGSTEARPALLPYLGVLRRVPVSKSSSMSFIISVLCVYVAYPTNLRPGSFKHRKTVHILVAWRIREVSVSPTGYFCLKGPSKLKVRNVLFFCTKRYHTDKEMIRTFQI